MPAPLLEIRDLVKRYGASTAVDGVTFSVGAGEVFGLLGPNGAGKTSTIGAAEGLLDFDAGSVRVFGHDVRTDGREWKRRVGVQLQSTSLLPDFGALDQIQLFARLYGRRLSRQEAEALLGLVGLSRKASRRPGSLSGGERQRLTLALAIVNEPQLVFLDEPTAGLDPQARHASWDLIRSLRTRGAAVVLTTHHIDEAEALCDRVGVLDRGLLVALERPAALIAAFGGPASLLTGAPLSGDDLKALPGVREVRDDGRRTRLLTDDLPATNRALLDLAVHRGVELSDLEVRPPTLEDVFLALTGRRMRET